MSTSNPARSGACTWSWRTSTSRGRALAAGGLEIGEIDDMGGMKYAGFSDPDGITWTLHEIAAVD